MSFEGTPGKLLPSAHAVDREFRVLMHCRNSVPVAKPYILCEDEDIVGSIFYVMSYEGEYFGIHYLKLYK